ncbi:MAG: DedA family protein, partial [candidate division NC10 bacterium]|nr:DedA family protein [candidate division NC10 bacterium]
MNLLSSLWPVFVTYGYAILFLGIALENAGLPLPGELFLFAAGFLASIGPLKLPLVIALGAAAAMVGDNLSYLLGRIGGERLPQLYCKLTLGSADCVRKTHDYFARRGGITIAFARFVVGVRLFAAPMAGSTGMAYPRFLGYDALGAFLWAAFGAGFGYLFGSRWDQLQASYHRYYGLVLLTVLLVALGYILMKALRRRRYGPALSIAGSPDT